MGDVSILKYSQGSRVLQTKKGNNVCFSDEDIVFNLWINTNVNNRPNTGDLTINFNTTLDYIIGIFNIGDNINLFKKVDNTSSISKSTKTNDDNNGPGNGINIENFNSNRIFLPKHQLDNIIKLSVSQGTVEGIQGIAILKISNLLNLKYLEINISQTPNFSFLENLPNISSLNFKTTPGNLTNQTYLFNSNIRYFIFSGYNTYSTKTTLIDYLPTELYYFKITQSTSMVLDLKDYYTGYRIGLNISSFQSVNTVSYTGGAVFPSVISPKEQSIDYILNTMNIPNKLSGDAFAQFLIDFANQVTSCTLPSSSKKIRCYGVTPNTSYTDTSQPIYQTYTDALAYVTGTLGITVSFT